MNSPTYLCACPYMRRLLNVLLDFNITTSNMLLPSAGKTCAVVPGKWKEKTDWNSKNT